MASTSETGHIKNIAHLEDLIAYCQSYGADYNPSNPLLTVAQLQALYAAAQSAINDFKTQKTSFDTAINLRRDAFEDIQPLSTRIVNALIASGASKLTIDDAKGVNKKIQGIRSKKLTTDTTANDDATMTKTISTAQQSYDRLKDHLANMISILLQTSEYKPNENDLKIAQLQARLAALETSKTAWINAHTTYSNAIRDRNQLLYHPDTGITAVAQKVKVYVKSIYGSRSHQYKQVRMLVFKSQKTEL